MLGHQWWWEFDYPEQQHHHGERAAHPDGQARVPDALRRRLRLRGRGPQRPGPPAPSACQPGPPDGFPPAAIGASVIHSFWVPELAGTHRRDPEPDEPHDDPGGRAGDVPGAVQGVLRALARRHAVHAWSRTPRRTSRRGSPASRPSAAPPEPGSDAAAGLEVFVEHREDGACTDCHAVVGLEDADGEPFARERRPEPHALREPDVFRADASWRPTTRTCADGSTTRRRSSTASWMPDVRPHRARRSTS